MYAFGTTTTSKMCAVPDAKSTKDFNLNANFKKATTITLSGALALQYKQGAPGVRKYDSCYYSISSKLKNGAKRLLKGGGAKVGSF